MQHDVQQGPKRHSRDRNRRTRRGACGEHEKTECATTPQPPDLAGALSQNAMQDSTRTWRRVRVSLHLGCGIGKRRGWPPLHCMPTLRALLERAHYIGIKSVCPEELAQSRKALVLPELV